MAEALAVISIAANVLQICGFAGAVIERLDYCLGRIDDAPRLWEEIKTTLPTLTLTVKVAKDNAKADVKKLDQNQALEDRKSTRLNSSHWE